MQIDRYLVRCMDIQIDKRQIDRKKIARQIYEGRQMNIQLDRWIYKKIDKYISRQLIRYTDRQIDIYIDKCIWRQLDIWKDRQI